MGGDPAMVQMFAEIGVGQWFRYAIGALEVAGAGGVLVPRLSGLAALGLACVMIGAALTNAVVLGTSPLLPLALLVGALVAWGRRADQGVARQYRALSTRADPGPPLRRSVEGGGRGPPRTGGRTSVDISRKGESRRG